MKRSAFLVALFLVAGCGGGGGSTPPSTPDYFDEMTPSPSLRWSSTKTANPLKVFVDLDGGTDRSVMVMAAINQWATGTSNLVRFEKVSSSGAADIRISFASTVPEGEAGLGHAAVIFAITPGVPTTDGIITQANITLKSGVPDAVLTPLAIHEVGHGLGIVARNKDDAGHSSYSGDVMYATVTSGSALSSRDTGTLKKLYALSRVR